jgi:hypothetical protein
MVEFLSSIPEDLGSTPSTAPTYKHMQKEPGMVIHACNSSTQEAEEGGL